MSRRNDATGIGRRGATQATKPKIFVFCEGDVTEPEYFRSLKNQLEKRDLDIIIEKKGDKPEYLVRRARQRAEELERDERDEVWVVCDVDDHKYLKQAIIEARKEPVIEMAISNPCFEIWALLHFKVHGGAIQSPALRALIQQRFPDYDKRLPFATLYEHYDTAVKNARALDTEAARDRAPGRNPTTGVYRLTERIHLRS